MRALATALAFAAILAAPARAAELSTMPTSDFLALCARDKMACGHFVADVLGFFEAAAGFNEIQSYRVCAPNPFGDRDVSEVLDWIRANPDRAGMVAADAIGAAGEIIWPCP